MADYLLDADRDAALRRLRIKERLQDPGSIACFETIGVARGWRCLEVGAGSGSLAAWLCERVGPSGAVVATDTRVDLLAALARPSLTVLEHDVAADPLEEAAFDLVHARDVLVHVPGRDDALRSLARAVRPGGWLVLEEPDVATDGADPDVPASERELYERVSRAIFACLRERGLDPEYGRRLFARLRALGFEDVRAIGRVFSFAAGDESPHELAFPDVAPLVVESGAATRVELERFFALQTTPGFAWREALTVTAWGRRPR